MRADLLIIGGGLVGCATAWHVAKAGLFPLVVEARELNSGASGQNAGSLHFQIERRLLEQGEDAARVAAHVVTLNKQAIADWQGLEAQLDQDLQIAMHGGLMLAESDDDLRLLDYKCCREQELGLDTQLLNSADVQAMAPFLAKHIKGAAFLPTEGHANPRILTDAFANAAVKAGAEIRTGTRITALTMLANRSYRATLSNAQGSYEVEASNILLAAGAWSADIARLLGIHIPLYPVPLTMNVTERTEIFVPYLIQHVGKRLSLKQTEDGNIMIGGGWPSRFARKADGSLDLSAPPLPVEESITGNLKVAVSVVPRVASLNLIRSWTGITCISSDQLPIVGMVDAAPGLYIAAGGSAFTLGPTFARLLAEQIVHQKEPEPEIAMFAPRRFNHLNAFTVLP